MASNTKNGQGKTPSFIAKGADETPAWADGLRQLYDDVVEEPIPDSFKDLLDQLDKSDTDGGT